MEKRRFEEPNLGPTKTVRQHVTPRFHLDNFVEGGVIAGLDLTTGKTFATSPANAGVIKGFYDIEVGGVRLSLEDWLGGLEGEAAPILAKLKDDPSRVMGLRANEERLLARFLAAQTLRVPAFRDREAAMRGEVVEGIKSIAKSFLEQNEPPEDAQAIWEAWNSQPEWWWLQQPGPSQEVELSAAMLGEVEGWANLFRAMSWRAGSVSGGSLYTSDNPVSGVLPAVRPWSAGGGAIWEKMYFFPVSTEVLLVVGPMGYTAKSSPRGERSADVFSSWQTAYARHVITQNATRFLYGPGPYLTRECADACLSRIDGAKFWDAIVYQGFRPGPPAYQLSPKTRLMINAIDYSLAARGQPRPTLTKFEPPPPPTEWPKAPRAKDEEPSAGL